MLIDHIFPLTVMSLRRIAETFYVPRSTLKIERRTQLFLSPRVPASFDCGKIKGKRQKVGEELTALWFDPFRSLSFAEIGIDRLLDPHVFYCAEAHYYQ